MKALGRSQTAAFDIREAAVWKSHTSERFLEVENLTNYLFGKVITKKSRFFSFDLLVIGGCEINKPHQFGNLVQMAMKKANVRMPREKLARTAQVSSALSVVAAVPVALVFIFGGGNLLTLLYGEAYQGAYGALAVLAISKLVLAAYGSCGNLLNMTGHERNVVRALVLGLIVNCVMSLTLVPALGGLGAALATLAGTLVWNIQLSRKVAEKLSFSGTFFSVIFCIFRRK